MSSGKMRLEGLAAVQKRSKFPSKDSPEFTNGMELPPIRPKFHLTKGQKIFTIGSCFARNIEARLDGFDLPTVGYTLPEGEIKQNIGNRILNEYNPATMAQRITHAVDGVGFGDAGIEAGGGGHTDLLLSGGAPVTLGRLLERRAEIDAIYAHLTRSNALIVTLGLIEAWYDTVSKLYLNLFPGLPAIKASPGRYELHVLTVDKIVEMLVAAFSKVLNAGVEKIILTVSPVPMQLSFSGLPAYVANSRSKASLVVAAHEIVDALPQIDYFPSYEMVMSVGPAAFIDDLVHVEPAVVKRVTDHMLAAYIQR